MEVPLYPLQPVLNTKKLLRQCREVDLPIVAVDQNGKGSFSRPISAEEKTTFAMILSEHDPYDAREELRAALLAAGITPQEQLDALWEAVFAQNAAKGAEMQQQIEALKKAGKHG